jgi:hypothetical protein
MPGFNLSEATPIFMLKKLKSFQSIFKERRLLMFICLFLRTLLTHVQYNYPMIKAFWLDSGVLQAA